MGKRADEKAEARDRIVSAAAKRIREAGVAGLKVADIMADAGLTHGAFYAHFENKDALVTEAFRAALDHRDAWMGSARKQAPEDRASHLLRTYLTSRHRDMPEKGCAFACLARDFAQAEGPFPQVFEDELNISLDRLSALIGEGDESAREQAMGLLSLCVGGMVLARAVNDKTLSNQLLETAARYGTDDQRSKK